MTKFELDEINTEIDRIAFEMDWRDPNLEWRWFQWADTCLEYWIEILEKSCLRARRLDRSEINSRFEKSVTITKLRVRTLPDRSEAQASSFRLVGIGVRVLTRAWDELGDPDGIRADIHPGNALPG